MTRISIIIPTYNRPAELKNTIESILKQTQKPYEIIIVDDGNLKALPLEEESNIAGIKYIYYKKDRPGLTESRNKGIESANGSIIFFLDDDVILSSNYIEEILGVYANDSNQDVGGVGGIITNHNRHGFKGCLTQIFEVIFLISGFNEGRVLPSGFCTDFGTTGLQMKGIKTVDFLSGGVCSFRKKIFEEFSFNTEKYLNYGLGEDKDFSYKVSKRYKLFVNPKAQVLHLESPLMRTNKYKEGQMVLMDRYIFFKQHVKTGWWSWIFFYYAVFGYFAEKILGLLVFPKKDKIDRLRGLFNSLQNIIMRHNKQVK
jgi:glycosyltransferase involved in cell wall biosynthesis